MATNETSDKQGVFNIDVEEQSLNRSEDNLRRGNQSPPPPYGTVTSDPPPSYESIYGRLKVARHETNGLAAFVCSALKIIASTVGITIILAVILGVPISMIVMGSKYLHDCPAERMIPIYLIVGGVFMAFRMLISLFKRCCCKSDLDDDDDNKQNPCLKLLDLFNTAWFIAGCVYIYRTKDKFTSDPSDDHDNYCNYTLYWYAFWVNTSHYIAMALICCCVCLIACLAAIFDKD